MRELWAIDEAVEDIGKKRGKGDKPPSVQNVLLAAMIGRTYQDWLDEQDTSDIEVADDEPDDDDVPAAAPPIDLGPPDEDGLVGETSAPALWEPINPDIDPMVQTRGGE